MAIAASRHIATSRCNWDRLLTGDKARIYLVFYIRDRAFLHFRKAAHVVTGKKNIVLKLLRNESRGRFNFFDGELHIAFIAIKLGGIFQRDGLAPRFDV